MYLNSAFRPRTRPDYLEQTERTLRTWNANEHIFVKKFAARCAPDVDGRCQVWSWRPDELGALALLLVEDDDPNPYSAGIIDDEDDDDLDFSTNEGLAVTEDATRHIHALILMQSLAEPTRHSARASSASTTAAMSAVRERGHRY